MSDLNREKQEFARRLRDAMLRAGYEAKPAVLEREFNLRYAGDPMGLHGVRRWLLGETMPSADKVQVLADWLRVDAQQLLTGHKAHAVRENRKSWGDTVPAQEKEVVEAFLKLPASQKRIVRAVIWAFAQAYQKD